MKKNKLVIIGITSIIILIIFVYLRNLEIRNIDSKRDDISRLLEINDNVDKLSFIDIYVTPAIIAEYPSDCNAFYVVYNNNYYSILYMNKKEASKITKNMVDNGYRIYGVTKERPEDLKKYGLEFLEKIFASHEEGDGHNHEINDNSYEEYFGTIYLDATVSRFNETKIYNYIIYLMIFTISICILIPISKLIINKNN